MTSDFRYRSSEELDAPHAPWMPHGVPGKVAVTSRLPARTVILRERDGNNVAPDADVAVDRAAATSGHALPQDLRTRFESSLGADLSAVRIHTGAESAEAASAVGARAYATGNDIHFAAGTYDPSSAFGVHLIAHEVAHTVQQQGAAPTRQHKLEVSGPADSAEVEADRAADAMVAGTPAMVGSHGGGWLGRVGEDKTGKGSVTISTKGLKFNQEGSMKLGSFNIGDLAKVEVTGTLFGEEALEWSKMTRDVGVTVGGSYNGSKNEGGADVKGQFNWTPYKDKMRDEMHAGLGEKWLSGFDVTEKKLTVDFPNFKFREEAIEFGGQVMITYGFANQVKIAGGFAVVVKGGKDVKPTDQGVHFVGTGETPIFSGEADLGDDVKVKGKLSAKLEAKLKPDWVGIARKVLEEFGKKVAESGAKAAAPGAAVAQGAASTAQGAASTAQGAASTAQGAASTAQGAATTAAEGAAGTAEAAGGAALAETAIAVGGGLLIIAAMGYALAKGAQDLADADGVVLAANQARDSWAAGYCSGLGAVRAAPDMAAYGQGMTAGAAKLAAVLGEMRARLGSTPASDEELKAALAEQVTAQAGTIFANARKSVASDIGMKFVQAFWSAHAGSWYGRIGLSQTTRNIAGRLGVAWSPPAEDASDAPAPSGELANPGDAPGTCGEEASCAPDEANESSEDQQSE